MNSYVYKFKESLLCIDITGKLVIREKDIPGIIHIVNCLTKGVKLPRFAFNSKYIDIKQG